jgi:hypothetical protein
MSKAGGYSGRTMRHRPPVIAVLCCALALVSAATAADESVTLAVFGDWPYSRALLDAAPLLLASINRDSAARFVIHVGDIQSAATPCTGAG